MRGGVKSLQDDWQLRPGMEERQLPVQPHWVVPELHQSLSVTDGQGRDTSYIQNDGQGLQPSKCLTFSEKHIYDKIRKLHLFSFLTNNRV